VLTLTNNDGGGTLAIAPAVEWFVSRVSEVSDGHLTVRFEPGEWATDGREVGAVAAGKADLGWVGTRAFDLLDVDTLRALHAPLLIDSYALQAAVLADPASAQALSAIEVLGVEPLALLGDHLMFPASAQGPLRSPADWDEAGMWLLESEAYADAVRALGATPLHTFATGGDIRLMLQTGEADGLVSMWNYYTLGADYQHAPYTVPNVVFGPRTLALFANPASLATLSDDERAWLAEAAADATRWSVAHVAERDAGYTADACAHGASIAWASDAELAGLRELAEPLYARLAGDPLTAPLYASIDRLAAVIEPESPLVVPDGCAFDDSAPGNHAAEPLLGPGPPGDFPVGRYRYSVAASDVVRGQEVLALGDPIDFTVTWTIGAGEWQLVARPDDGHQASVTCRGWFAVDADRVQFTLQLEPEVGHCLPLDWSARWQVDASGAITWLGPVPGVLTPHFRDAVWHRID